MSVAERSLVCVAAVVLTGCLGCAVAMKPVRMAGLAPKDLTLQMNLAAGANADSVVAIDVVAVDDKKTLAEVSALTAAQWFQKKADMARMKGKDLRITSWEFVPGEVVPDQHLSSTVGKLGVVLFANYATPGEHRAVLPTAGKVQVEFGATDFLIAVAKENTAAPPEVKLPPAKAPTT